MAITVLLAEDNALMRTALRTFLMAVEGFQVVAEAADGLEAVRMSDEIRPDVVVMDVGLPTIDGLEATRRILSSRPSTSVVVLSGSSNAATVKAAQDAGATTVVPKERAFELLVPAIKTAAARAG